MDKRFSEMSSPEQLSAYESACSEVSRLKAQLGEYSRKCVDAADEIIAWKEASGLECGGDPDGVTPKAAAEHWGNIERIAQQVVFVRRNRAQPGLRDTDPTRTDEPGSRDTTMVMIYEDPLTKTKPEGKARLIKLLDTDRDGGTERWLVHFEGDDEGDYYERTIQVPPNGRRRIISRNKRQ